MDEADRARYAGIPGWELVSVGLADLAEGRETVAALLVASASERLRAIGLGKDLLPRTDDPGRLYALVEVQVGVARAHSRYNALRRRLASFLRTVDAQAG